MVLIAIVVGCLVGALIGIYAPIIPYTYSGYLERMKDDGVIVDVKKSEGLTVKKYEGIITTKYLKNDN